MLLKLLSIIIINIYATIIFLYIYIYLFKKRRLVICFVGKQSIPHMGYPKNIEFQ